MRDRRRRGTTPPPPSGNQPIRQEVVPAGALRLVAVLGTVGMLAVLLALFILAMSRPQGVYRALDQGQHQAALARAEERLSGFTALDTGAATLDIGHAMQLVMERGIDVAMVEGGVAPTVEVRDVDDEEAEELAAVAIDGAPIFGANCAACHQATGTGIPGAFPPLANHVYELYAADRDLLPTILLYGLQGPIEVHGQAYNGLMPAFAQLGDDDIAAILNHLMTAWGDADQLDEEFEPFVAEDVEALRGQGLSGAAVHGIRQELGLP